MEKRLVEVVAALIRRDGRFMICRRPAHKACGLLWEFVGGKVEPGESNAEALIRECREELDVTVRVGAPFMSVTHDYPDYTVHMTLYAAIIVDGEPRLLEHADIRWITPEEIPLYEFCPADRDILKEIVRRAGKGRKEDSGSFSSRQSGLDFIRAVACFLVILIHVSCLIFYSFSDSWTITVAFDSMARMCVPLFFMLTGYLLFDGKENSLIKYYKNRFSRILIPFIIFLIIFKLFFNDDSLFVYIKNILSQNIQFHLWYIYNIIGIYITIPFLWHFFSSDENIKFAYFYLIIWFIVTVCYPMIKDYYSFEVSPFTAFNFNFFFGYLGYCILGGLLKRVKITKISYRIIALVIMFISTFATYKLTIFFSIKIGKPHELFFSYTSPFVFMQAVSFFLSCKDIKIKSKFIEYISIHTYWIYLIHIIVETKLISIFTPSLIEYAIIKIPFLTMLTFLISLLISIPLLKLENYLKKYLLGLGFIISKRFKKG